MENEQKDIRYQNITLTIPAGSVIGKALENNAQLDRAYDRITGIQMSVINDELGNKLLLGAKSQRRTWIDLIPRSAYNAEESVSPNTKFMDVNIQYGGGDIFYVQSQNLAIPAADVIVYMTLRLEVGLVELPK